MTTIAAWASAPSDEVRIFDTTLRDGEQSPGATMTGGEKLEVALALARLGVDVIEAGFPAASSGDLRAVQALAETVGGRVVAGRKAALPPIVCALARAAKGDIDKAAEAVRPAARPRIHTFLATSDLHLEHKLRMTRAQVVERVKSMVAYARERCVDVEFSCEDATRSDPEFLFRVLEVAIASGATTVNIPDTVGYTTPEEFGALITAIRENVSGIDRAVLSVHCHDDLGMAVANSLAGIRAGARQAEVTINGIGERAGNASLEELVMALATRRPRFGLGTNIDTPQLTSVSRLVAQCTGMLVPPNKAIVGANAFAHESGIHQDGMLKHESTYEIMRPETVGALQTRLVLGKHSGRHALASRVEELGYAVDEAMLNELFTRFKEVADKKKSITDADLEALVATTSATGVDGFALETLQVVCGTTGTPTATVRLRGPDGREHVRVAVGTGPVHAAFLAIDEVVGERATLLEFSVHAVTAGIDALGEVSVRIRGDEATSALPAQHDARASIAHGHGADTDIVIASAKAYVAALNRLRATRRRSQTMPAVRAGALEGSSPEALEFKEVAS